MYEELYNNTHNAQNNEAILTQHILNKKLHSDEDPKLSLRVQVVSVTENFCQRFPHELAKKLANILFRARHIYDIIQMLSVNQIWSIKNIMTNNIRKIAQKDIYKVVNYCK